MRKKQLGVSLMGLLMGAVILIALALLGMRMAPSYIEFVAIKKAINSIAQEKRGAPAPEIRKAFDARASIDDITTIGGKELEITKQGSDTVISVNYRKELPLFARVGLFIDFYAVSQPGQ
jgi:hypothetical protein